jgi:hypothetical protein
MGVRWFQVPLPQLFVAALRIDPAAGVARQGKDRRQQVIPDAHFGEERRWGQISLGASSGPLG